MLLERVAIKSNMTSTSIARQFISYETTAQENSGKK